MKTLYDYIFLKIYLLMKRTPGKRTADDGALMMLLIALFLYTFPFVLFIIDYFIGKTNFWILIGVTLIYSYILYKVNKSYFIDKQELPLILDRFKDESKIQSIIGYVLVIAFVLFSFVAFFLLLSL